MKTPSLRVLRSFVGIVISFASASLSAATLYVSVGNAAKAICVYLSGFCRAGTLPSRNSPAWFAGAFRLAGEGIGFRWIG
jgi:hypothetical protein